MISSCLKGPDAVPETPSIGPPDIGAGSVSLFRDSGYRHPFSDPGSLFSGRKLTRCLGRCGGFANMEPLRLIPLLGWASQSSCITKSTSTPLLFGAIAFCRLRGLTARNDARNSVV